MAMTPLDAETDVPASRDGSEDHRLLAPSVWAATLPADVGLIDLDGSGELSVGRDFPHSPADPVAEVPSGFVAHAEGQLELVGAHALLGFAHEVGSEEPLPERKVGVMEDRSGLDREAVPAAVAVELVARRDPRDRLEPARGAADALRPTESFEVRSAAILGAELLDELDEVHRSALAIDLGVMSLIGAGSH